VISVRSGESSWCLAPQSDGWAVGAHGYTSSALEIEPGDLVLVATGRSEVSEVLERAKIEGDATAIERVLRAWRVV
ncbi:MAG TPA: hypothetical protein VM600_09880, partial [Actinomycetota bacterium]|nr:hypothetical protein [Actinomycetota bacterium]